IYNETLRPSPLGGHEGPAKATPHPSPIGVVLHSIWTVSRSSTRAVPERRASHRRDAFVGLQRGQKKPTAQKRGHTCGFALRNICARPAFYTGWSKQNPTQPGSPALATG
ncbi:hypothetical protein B0H14DRAFT_2362320, partial [Mycena olivaceomarginata]